MAIPERERETVVVTEGGGGGPGAMIAGIIVAILVVLAIIYFVGANQGGSGVEVSLPAVDVNVTPQ